MRRIGFGLGERPSFDDLPRSKVRFRQLATKVTSMLTASVTIEAERDGLEDSSLARHCGPGLEAPRKT